MAPEEIANILKDKFSDKITGSGFETAHPHVFVEAKAWPEVARFMKDDPQLRMNLLRSITSVDMLEDDELIAVYDLCACRPGDRETEMWEFDEFCVKVKVPRNNPHIPSVADVWSAADWHEREAYDLMGIVFDDHPDSVLGPEGRHPRRILCPDDWEGYPLRKDYRFPMEYHGIPAVTEYEQTRPVH